MALTANLFKTILEFLWVFWPGHKCPILSNLPHFEALKIGKVAQRKRSFRPRGIVVRKFYFPLRPFVVILAATKESVWD